MQLTLMSQLIHHLLSHFVGQLRIVIQELLDRITALTYVIALIGEPRATLLEDAHVGSRIDDLAYTVNALTEEYVKLSTTERRSHLVLDHTHTRHLADHIVALLNLLVGTYV